MHIIKNTKNMSRLGILDLKLLIRSIRLNWGYEFWYMIDINTITLIILWCI